MTKLFQDIKTLDIIDSMAKFKELIALLLTSEEVLFFRGQPNYNYELKSSYLRNEELGNSFSDWKRKINFIQDKQSDSETIDILSFFQHYDSNTIFIDLTSRLFIAIWFAVNSQENENDNSSLYVFKYNEEIKYKVDKLEEPKYIYKCSSKVERGLSQNSYFILDNIDWETEEGKMYLKIKLDQTIKKDILKFLKNKQISAENLFPDLEGLMNYPDHPSWAYIFNNRNLSSIKKDPQKTIKTLDEAIKLAPNNTNVYNNKGTVLLWMFDKPKESIKLFEKAIELDPSYAEAYNNKGVALSKTNKPNEAIKEFDKAIKLNPKNILDIYNNKGIALADCGRHKEAIAIYNAVIKLKPNDADTNYNKGLAFSKTKKYQEAIKQYDIVIKSDYTYSDAYTSKGNALSKLQKYKEAIKQYDIAIQLKPSDSLTYKNKGMSLSNLKMYEEAIIQFDIAIKLDSSYSIAYVHKGMNLANLKMYEEAIIQFDLAIKLDPNNPGIYTHKGILLLELNKKKEAKKALDKVIELSSNLKNQKLILQ